MYRAHWNRTFGLSYPAEDISPSSSSSGMVFSSFMLTELNVLCMSESLQWGEGGSHVAKRHSHQSMQHFNTTPPWDLSYLRIYPLTLWTMSPLFCTYYVLHIFTLYMAIGKLQLSETIVSTVWLKQRLQNCEDNQIACIPVSYWQIARIKWVPES